MRPPRPGADPDTTARVSTTAITATGRLTRKIARQPQVCVSNPPSSGPAAAARPLTAPQTPNAVPRRRPW